jgi:hypothetical protein
MNEWMIDWLIGSLAYWLNESEMKKSIDKWIFKKISETGSYKDWLMVIGWSNIILNEFDYFGNQIGLSIIECKRKDWIRWEWNIL